MDFAPMSPEERERMMQFLLSQQAQFAADHAKGQERLDRVEGALVAITGVMGRMADHADQRFAALAQAQAETEARLTIVVDMFERHLRHDHGVQ